MRKIILALLATTAVIVPASAASATPEHEDKKVYVCHWANGNPHVIHISVNGLNGHFEDDGVTPKDVPGHAKDYVIGAELTAADSFKCAGGENGEDGEDGEDGTDGKDGKDGEDGKSGNDGAVGPAGPVGPVGPQGPAGTPADAARIEALERLVTELNNRLFILEHTAPEVPATPATPAPVTGELPKTGSNTPLILTVAFLLLAAGTAFRLLARRG